MRCERISLISVAVDDLFHGRLKPQSWKANSGALVCLSFKPESALAAASAVSATTTISGEGVLSLRFMASIAYVASAIPCLVSLEVVEACGAAVWQWSCVTVMRIKAVVDMAIEATMAVEPWASPDKYPASEPIGPIVPVRSAVIRGIVEIPVRTTGSRSDVYANGHLCSRNRCIA